MNNTTVKAQTPNSYEHLFRLKNSELRYSTNDNFVLDLELLDLEKTEASWVNNVEEKISSVNKSSVLKGYYTIHNVAGPNYNDTVYYIGSKHFSAIKRFFFAYHEKKKPILQNAEKPTNKTYQILKDEFFSAEWENAGNHSVRLNFRGVNVYITRSKKDVGCWYYAIDRESSQSYKNRDECVNDSFEAAYEQWLKNSTVPL